MISSRLLALNSACKLGCTTLLSILFFGFLSLAVLSGCSSSSSAPSSFYNPGSSNVSSLGPAWLNSGALSFGGPVPEAPKSQEAVAANSPTLKDAKGNVNDYSYGFAPSSSAAKSLVLDLTNKVAKLIQAGKELASAQLLDWSGLQIGSYTIAHKQRNPLWYAPQHYFSARGLSIPAEGDKQRFLRGAFGDFALFVSPTEAIHTGPFSLDDVTGARIDEQDFAKIFYQVDVGDSIQVK